MPDPGLSHGRRGRIVAVVLALALGACATLPVSPPRPPTHAYADTDATRLGRAIAVQAAGHPGRAGVYALPSGRDAFAARFALAAAAERSIDVQYYIWRADTSGTLLAHALWLAAERGVRVRLLLDDVNTKGLDPLLATLDAHRNIEVRLFNPFPNRHWRVADYAGDFARVNRRMHNKSFTVDNQATVVGGRNIGDEYLGAGTAVAFADLDVLAAGPVVREVSASFDDYWNSEPAFPLAALVPPASEAMQEEVRVAWARLHEDPAARGYTDAIRRSDIVREWTEGRFAGEWVRARLVADDPGKVLASLDGGELATLPRLRAALGRPERELLLVSPYFVPGAEGTAALLALAREGVRIQVLTNSLAATDVAPVYAGYVRYREALVRGGVRVFELKPQADMPRSHGRSERGGAGGSSGASLHAKTFAVDGQRIYIGSFNLDPRSARLNTELGLVMESSALAGELARAFEDAVPRNAYEVRLNAGGTAVEWFERTDGGTEVRHATTPHTGVLRSLWIGVLSVLPIEWLL